MKPVTLTCRRTISLSPTEIAARILDVDNWTDFKGFGPIPGIKAAEFEIRTPEIVGTRFRVTNTDGSRHVEEIVFWQPERRLQLRMCDFSPPFSRLATGMDETWEFERTGGVTQVTRHFAMHPKSLLTRPILWLISFLLRAATNRHLRQMR